MKQSANQEKKAPKNTNTVPKKSLGIQLNPSKDVSPLINNNQTPRPQLNTPADILFWQRTVGNQTVQHLLQRQTDGESLAQVSEPAPNDRLEVPLELDLDEDGQQESHTLFMKEDGELWLHSDEQTLSNYIKKQKRQLTSPNDQILLRKIEFHAKIAHTGRYGTKYKNSKGYTKTKAPTSKQRSEVKPRLLKIAQYLTKLSDNKAKRPPSHKQDYVEKNIGSDTFCEKIVMEPLSILPRDDSIEGSSPSEETSLWRRLTNIAGYKRGHMLNEHLHGPGKNENLVPISTAFNSTMKMGVENAAKQAVNSENRVVRFEAEAQDWGQYLGIGGYPDEKLLPNKFYFKVTEMENHTGDGTQVADWRDTGNVIFEDNPIHDIPNDPVKGLKAHAVKTFQPGLYFRVSGSTNFVDPNYYLKGQFNLNGSGFSAILPALGLDDPSNLNSQMITETIIAEYELPSGYEIALLPSQSVEILYLDKIITVNTPDNAFIVYHKMKRPILQQEYAQMLEDFKEKKERLAQAQLEQEDEQRLKREEWKLKLEQERADREKAKQLEQEHASQNEEFRHTLLKTIRNETRHLVEEFGHVFANEREYILHDYNNIWKMQSDLFEQDMNETLTSVREEIEEQKGKFAEAKEILETLLERFYNKIDKRYRPRLVSYEAQEKFEQAVETIRSKHEPYWEEKTADELIEYGVEGLWKSPNRLLEKAYRRAKSLDIYQVQEDSQIRIKNKWGESMREISAGTKVQLTYNGHDMISEDYCTVIVQNGPLNGQEGELLYSKIGKPSYSSRPRKKKKYS